MKLYYTLRNKLNLLVIPVVLFALVSCGSYQYSGYEADGIYGESRPGIWEQEDPQTTEVKPNNKNSYYKDLFAQQSEMVGEALESDVFTDVDSYTSNDGYENYSEVGGDVVYLGGNAPWGEDPDTYTVNIYNNGFFRGYTPWLYGLRPGIGFGWGYPYYGYDPYWPGGWGGYGPYAYGYGGSYWNFGFRFGHRFGYGYGGYYNPYYPYYRYHHSNYNNYYNDNIAYNRGRRNSTATYRDGESRRSSYSRSIREIRSSRSSDYGTSRVRRSASANNDDARIYTRTNRRTESSRTYDTNRSRNSSPVYQRSSQSNNRTYRSSPSRRSSSSSNTVRSSGSSSRSSGSTSRSSGGRSSRGGRGGGQ